jgi:hypothetical protein
MERVFSHVVAWQNQFDGAILAAAAPVALPPWVSKRVIAEESQLWPGSIADLGEFGVGHLTEVGADNALLWNAALYQEVCTGALASYAAGPGCLGEALRRSYGETRRVTWEGVASELAGTCPAVVEYVDHVSD